MATKISKCEKCNHGKWEDSECTWCLFKDLYKPPTDEEPILSLNKGSKTYKYKRKPMSRKQTKTKNESFSEPAIYRTNRLRIALIEKKAKELFDVRWKMIASLILAGRSARYIYSLDTTLNSRTLYKLERIYKDSHGRQALT
jgi:hypothetical protein